MKLRSHLVWLTLATLLPMALFAAAATFFLVERERNAFRDGAQDRVSSILSAVDTQLNGSITSLEALATLRSLDRNDLTDFREDARRVLASQPNWSNIHLALPDGHQLMNLRTHPGERLPAIVEIRSFRRLEIALMSGKNAPGGAAREAYARSAWALARAASYGRGSIRKRRSPFFTSTPSLNSRAMI